MVQLPAPMKDKKVIEAGEFEFETYVSKAELIEFLKGLLEQIERGDEITISSDEWEIKFNFNEPIEVEVEFDGDAKKLKIEIEFRQRPKIKLQHA